MNNRVDVTALTIGLVGIGFGLALLFAPHISGAFIQPILAVIMAVAGTIGLFASRGRNRKETL